MMYHKLVRSYHLIGIMENKNLIKVAKFIEYILLGAWSKEELSNYVEFILKHDGED